MSRWMSVVLLLIPVICFSERIYEEKNGILCIEAEHTLTDQSQWGDWSLKTNISGYTGEGHIEFDDGTMGDRSPGSQLVYKFRIVNGGTYTLHLRAHKRLEGAESDKCNDAYVRLKGDFTTGSSQVPQSALTQNTKLYGGAANGWGWASNLDGNGADHTPAKYNLKAGEIYTFYLVGRSIRFNVDRIVFEKNSNWRIAPESDLAAAFDHIEIDNSNYRIALSHDGNAHDKDDILAAPLALAIIHHAGVKDKFVFMDYSNHLWDDDGNQPAQMRESVNGACQRWGFDPGKTFEVRENDSYQAAKDSFKTAAIEAYDDGARLYYACGGPMEVPYQMLNQLEEKYRDNITVITHSQWNNDHSNRHGAHDWDDLKQIAGASTWIDNQNDQVWKDSEANWQWLENENEHLEWLYGRNFKNQWDGSDAGMTYYIVTGRGNENATMNDAKDLFRNGPPFSAGEQDTIPPDVSMSINKTVFDYGETMTVNATVTDSTNEVLRAELFIDDASIAVDSKAPYEFSVKATFAGTHQVYVKGFDKAFNTAVSESVEITVANPSPEEALVAHYPLNGNLNDIAGENHGSIIGGPVFEQGVKDQAIKFDGTDDAVEIPQLLKNDFTVSFWMKTTISGENKNHWWGGIGVFDAEMVGYTTDFGLSMLGDHICFGIGDPSSGDVTIVSSTPVNDDQWHHIAATRNSSTGLVQLYVDGVKEASDVGSTMPRSAPPRITLGCIQLNENYFKGMMDDVQIFNAVFGDSLITALAHGSSVDVQDTRDGQRSDAMPKEFSLSHNYPNPFNPSTTLTYHLPVSATVNAAVFNVTGKKVRQLTLATLPAGVHSLNWDGLDNHDRKVGSGIYYLHLKAESGSQRCQQMEKMVLLK